MNFREFLKDNIVIFDGGLGTLLQKQGLKAGEHPETWNISHADIVQKIHTDYFNAGSNIVNTNTFGANRLNFASNELETIIKAAVDNVKIARDNCVSNQPKFVALDIGPTGKLLKPFGDFDFEEAVDVFAETVKIGVKYGVDLIYIETMNDSYETKAAVLAAKENCNLPIIASNAYGEDGKLMTGASPAAMVAMLEGLGVDVIGANCSLGPKQLKPIVNELLKYSSLPVMLKPNAGLPKIVDGKTVYDIDVDEFADEILSAVNSGIRIVGGCCGTTPDYISKVSQKIIGIKPIDITEKNITCVSSYTHVVEFGEQPILIGERINPTGKKRFKQALVEHDIDYILNEGINQQEKGVHILDVNVGLPEIDESELLKTSVCELQAIINLPLQIDTSDINAMESALRVYNGKAMINSVNGKQESMHSVFPLVKKYGGLVVALTLDEDGIPSTAEGRVKIAEKILETAENYGISKKDIIFDTLAMTISADTSAAIATLRSMREIRERLGCNTSLGVSNISFGLPNRDFVNSVFFEAALENGLSAAIMNPYSLEMMKTYYAYRAIHNLDSNCTDYIGFASGIELSENKAVSVTKSANENYNSDLQKAIIKGLKELSGEITNELIKSRNPLDIVTDEIIPALDIVGKGFEKKEVYLPQLLMSAEAAKSAFEIIKSNMQSTNQSDKATVVIATVKGDIHDIGKNIVKLLLENYGFNVIDLGKDVSPDEILKSVIKYGAPLVGLSALMTTTVPAMEETVKLIKEKAPFCKTVVGGAVLTEDYAKKIGAHKYAKDAMETVRYAEEICR